jgi:repressor of nif and glnA expression
MVVPAGYMGVGTVCSITLNGVLLAQKIPMSSRFGGLLEIQNARPSRFVAIINYDGTSLDPLEIFIKSGMTDYLGATGDGNGLIGAGFREIPARTRDHVVEIAAKLEKIGLGGFLTIGMPNGDVSEIPVSEGNVGAIVIGGLNPIDILEEAGFEVHSRALSGIIPYKILFPFHELEKRATNLINR